jgi:5-(carboxyamino)imidazole ribonucleotide synthase
MVGGGQLARMTHPAALALGVRLAVLAEHPHDSAALVTQSPVIGSHLDAAAVRGFARGVDVLTFDHEHVPTDLLRELQDAGHAVRPGPDALVHAQDKGVMRLRLSGLDVPMPRFALVSTPGELDAFAGTVGWPVVLKTARGGYDGRGVQRIATTGEAFGWLAHAAASGVPLLAEEAVPFRRELAALVSRSPSGQAAAWPVVATTQIDGVCREVIAPAPGLPADLALEATEIALRIAGALDVVGVLAVEMFEVDGGSDGGSGRVLVNELAMRPHNSGHWSIDGAVTGQFEQHLRAVLDLPLGDPRLRSAWSVMVNVLGGDRPDLYRSYLHVMARDPALKVHLYGKTVRPGRKIGHVTVCTDDPDGLDDALARARHAADFIRGAIDE